MHYRTYGNDCVMGCILLYLYSLSANMDKFLGVALSKVAIDTCKMPQSEKRTLPVGGKEGQCGTARLSSTSLPNLSHFYLPPRREGEGAISARELRSIDRQLACWTGS